MENEELENKIVIYETEDGKTQLDVKLENETVWLEEQWFPQEGDSVNIYVYTDNSSQAPYLFWWGGKSTAPNWPGVKMTETRLVGDSLFYTKRLPKGTSIIFSLVDDNAQDISSAAMKTQTEDINDVERDTWYYFYQADGPASQNKKGRYKDITYQINQRIVSGVSIPFRKPTTGKTVRYNLAGQRVSSSYKGIVIENGRKVIVH